MGTFIKDSKRVVLKNCCASDVLQLDNAISLLFYIIERNNETQLTSIDYQVEKLVGRNTVVLTTWTPVDVLGIEDSLYTFDYTLSSATVTAEDKILIKFKVIDVDGIESFIELNDFTVTA